MEAERAVVVAEGDLALRRLRDHEDDLRLLVRWRNEPHVRQWWDPDDPPATLASVRAKYAPRAAPGSATTACVIERDGRPVGYIQFYPWSAYAAEAEETGMKLPPGSFGLDVFVGEPDLVGCGLGSRAVDLLCRHLEADCGATAVTLAVAVENGRARRAYEKAGFRAVGRVLDTDTRGGERVECWQMLRERA